MSVNYYDKDNDQLTKLAGSSALVMDSTPSSGSTNPVTSNGIYEALATKQNNLSFDSTPTASSTNPVTSGGVKTALDDKLAKSTISDAYNSATQYGVEGNSSGYPTYCISNDVVYECISACVGVAPPNATYWKAHVLADWIGQLSSDIADLNSEVKNKLLFSTRFFAADASGLQFSTQQTVTFTQDLDLTSISELRLTFYVNNISSGSRRIAIIDASYISQAILYPCVSSAGQDGYIRPTGYSNRQLTVQCSETFIIYQVDGR